MTRAGFGQRFVAYLIDHIILGVIYVVLSMLVGAVLGLGGFFAPDGGVANNTVPNAVASFATLVYALILWALQFLYFGYFFSTSGQTPGKRVMGIKAVSRDGGPLSFARGGFRGTFGYWVSGLLFGLGFIWSLFDANSETWHDKMFGTRVVQVQS